MNGLTCNIVGDGHAGLAALKTIKEATRGMANRLQIRVVQFDKQPGHVRKVMLFRPAADGEEITVAWTRYFSEGVEFVQGTGTSVESDGELIRYADGQGKEIGCRAKKPGRRRCDWGKS